MPVSEINPGLRGQSRTVVTRLDLASAELAEVAGRKLVFKLTASDDVDTVAKAVHVRYVVKAPRFLQGVAAKQARQQAG